LTGTLSDEGWGPRDDKIVQFASHYFLYFPIFHLKYSYIFPIFCPSEFLYSYFFVKKVTGRPVLVWRKGNIEKNCLCVHSIVYCYNGTQRYEQLLQVGRLYRALILIGLALSSQCLCVFGLRGAIYIYFFFLNPTVWYLTLAELGTHDLCASMQKTGTDLQNFDY